MTVTDERIWLREALLSGSTTISEAWFARLLGIPFTAVMPACTAAGKIRDVRARRPM